MPLVVVAGRPCTGKTSFSQALLSYLLVRGIPTDSLVLVNDECLGTNKSTGYHCETQSLCIAYADDACWTPLRLTLSPTEPSNPLLQPQLLKRSHGGHSVRQLNGTLTPIGLLLPMVREIMPRVLLCSCWLPFFWRKEIPRQPLTTPYFTTTMHTRRAQLYKGV